MKCPQSNSEQSQAETRTGAVMTVLFAFMAPARRNATVFTPVDVIARNIQNSIRVISHFHYTVTFTVITMLSILPARTSPTWIGTARCAARSASDWSS